MHFSATGQASRVSGAVRVRRRFQLPLHPAGSGQPALNPVRLRWTGCRSPAPSHPRQFGSDPAVARGGIEGSHFSVSPPPMHGRRSAFRLLTHPPVLRGLASCEAGPLGSSEGKASLAQTSLDPAYRGAAALRRRSLYTTGSRKARTFRLASRGAPPGADSGRSAR